MTRLAESILEIFKRQVKFSSNYMKFYLFTSSSRSKGSIYPAKIQQIPPMKTPETNANRTPITLSFRNSVI